jgi:hypothetical protein
MSHLIEEYAKNLGVKIGKPVVSPHFFPIIPEKYITISLEPSVSSQQYKYFNIALDGVRNFLKKNSIKTIQIGSSQAERLSSVDEMIFDLDFKKEAYIVQRSMLHIGTNDKRMHYASSQNIPVIALFGNTFASSCDGYWSNQDKKINLEAPWSNKPPFNSQDPEDSINKIKPEEISNAILKLLGHDKPLSLTSLFIGDFYHSSIFELVPDFFSPSQDMQNKHWFIRLDYVDSYSYLESWADFLESFSFFSFKAIPHDFILKIKHKLKNINFIVDESCIIPTNYIDFLMANQINVTLLVRDEKILPQVRNHYFDYNVQIYAEADRSFLNNKNVSLGKSFFHSSKTIISRGKKYPSTYHWKKDKNILDKNFVLEDNDDLLKELNHFYIYDTK